MNKKRLLIASVFVLILLTSSAVAGYMVYNTFFTPAFRIAGQARIYIDRDDSSDSLSCKVQEVLAPRSMKAFDWLMQHEGYIHVKPGCYSFDANDNLRMAVRRLGLGWQSPIRLIVPSVRTLDRMAQSLSKQLMIEEEEIIHLLTDKSYVDSLGYVEETLPALFVPNTYEVYWDISVDGLMQRLQKENLAYWNNERRAKAQLIGLTPVEVATLASIVDEETAVNVEKPIVAGLYLNRLQRGMLLQADPTVKYATGDPTLRRILNKHLTIDSPYNTYLYNGLPPGPIRIPSMVALEAVLNPARHNYIYMCAKEDFSGTHNFATTLAQHNANARRYQQALNKRGIK